MEAPRATRCAACRHWNWCFRAAPTRSAETFAPAPLVEREIAVFEVELGGKRTAPATAADGIRTIVLADAVRQSVRAGRVMAVDPFVPGAGSRGG